MRTPRLEPIPENFHTLATFQAAYIGGPDWQKSAIAAPLKVSRHIGIAGCTKMRAGVCGSAASLRKCGL
jgi:hypothetical protein